MDVYLERGAFVLGDTMKLKIDIENNSNESVQQMKVELKNVSLVLILFWKLVRNYYFPAVFSNCIIIQLSLIRPNINFAWKYMIRYSFTN